MRVTPSDDTSPEEEHAPAAMPSALVLPETDDGRGQDGPAVWGVDADRFWIRALGPSRGCVDEWGGAGRGLRMPG